MMEGTTVEEKPEASGDHSQKVATHYNQLAGGGKFQRTFSRIYYLRNFNNWIKSVLINETLEKIRGDSFDKKISVLDLCSGRGGDLLKWKKGRISRLVCADIAEAAVEANKDRYRQNCERDRGKTFDAEFIAADCTRTRLKSKYQDPSQKFDLASCQFSFHYSFESYRQAITMLRNACECLKVGGYFIGTTTNANEIVHRLRNSEGNSFGNEVYKISFPDNERTQFPLFGASYNFHLEGVVDCPEFLVYFPVLEKLAAQFGMRLVEKKTFAQFFQDNVSKSDYADLLSGMQALEPYPSLQDKELASTDPQDYSVAQEFLSRLSQQQSDNSGSERSRGGESSVTIGTLSKAEWEAATVYMVFVFEKVEDISPPLFV